MMYVAILAGGVGTRLWPRSRLSQPKQFSDISGAGRTMIQATVDRVGDLTASDYVYVVTGDRYAPLAAEQLPEISATQVIAEPSGRNTGPAIGLACVYLYHRDPDAIIAFMHSDHIIVHEDRFRTALRRARDAAAQGYIVTLGITPDSPHTGYGYIKRSDTILPATDEGELPVYTVDRFLEKPDRTTAEAFLADGGYYWNGGIFVCRVERMLAELQRQTPDVHACLQEIAGSLETPHAHDVLRSAWEKMPSISIDHAVMEGAERVAVVPLDAGWNDVGSWDALETVIVPDQAHNYIAKGDVTAIESHNNIVFADKKVALIGLEDIVIVETADALLIGHKAKMQKVKDVVEQLRADGRTDLL